MPNMSLPNVAIEPVDIRLRAYLSGNLKGRPRRNQPVSIGPMLTFDCETRTDASQRLRFGAYRLDEGAIRTDGENLLEEGLFYDGGALDPAELDLLQKYATTNDLRLLPFEIFTEEVLFGRCYDRSGTVIGFNLPFDLSRLALEVSQARATGEDNRFRGGFSFRLSNDPSRQRLRIRHVDRRRAFIQFQREGGSGYSGYFVDVKTLSAALLTGATSLASVAKLLGTKTQKSTVEAHGKPLTDDYIDYARNDVNCTWECYTALLGRLAKHDLPDLRPMDVFSEASIGKAYLRAMGIKPWRQTEKLFSPELIGIIMSSYFGGRTEVRIRRAVREVLYADFLSMYPTVNTLQGLWRFLIAEETLVDESDTATEWARAFLETVTPEMMQRQDSWPKLTALVQVLPQDDLLPIRAAFGNSKSTNIGLNHLSSQEPLWFTLADCVAAKLLTGNVPRVVKAIRFAPGEHQADLTPKRILGLEKGWIDPAEDDFFKRLIELRQDVKATRDEQTGDEYARLDTEQDTLKIIANATSYGHLIEMNPDELQEKTDGDIYGAAGEVQKIHSNITEQPGEFFHPLLATLITGAARLMLALAEKQAFDERLIWSFCDTDGLALAKPEDVDREEFHRRADRVLDWLKPLNPYAGQLGKSILRREKENFSLDDERQPEPLYCYAVSAKRYALFNITNGQGVIRKASAHGLGFWRAPFQAPNDAPDTGTPFWQSELWRLFCQAALDGRDSDGFSLENDERFRSIAAGQTTISKWEFYKWFDRFNEGREFRDGVQPFNFLLRFPTKRRIEIDEEAPEFAHWCEQNVGEPSLVAPYDASSDIAAKFAFQRDARPGSWEASADYSSWLTTFADVLWDYDIHAEAKFHGGSAINSGELVRRRVEARKVLLVGKESHEWEENEALGLKADPEVQFGEALPDFETMFEAVRSALADGRFSSNEMSELARVSKSAVSAVRSSSNLVSSISLKKMFSVLVRAR